MSNFIYKEIKVNSFEEITKKIHSEQVNDGNRRAPLIRGEKSTFYSPTPSIFRSGFHSEREQDIIFEFLRNVPAHSNIDVKNLWNVLSLAQHHGAPTRLLDWTISPLVAIFFAVESENEEDAAVWSVWGLGDVNEKLPENPFNIDHIYRINPIVINPRISVQSAKSTAHPDGRDIREWLNPDDLCLKLIIPGDLKYNMLQRLDFLGITRASLFPGLDGLGSWLKWRAKKDVK